MLRQVIFAIVCAVVLAAVPFVYERKPDLFGFIAAPAPESASHEAAAKIAAGTPQPSGTEVLPGRKVRIAADRYGHFNAEFRLNGRNVEAMIDTGATLVAMNASTARRVGIRFTPADFKYSVRTANGEARAAAVTIEQMQIGRILVDNVDAIVLDDRALDGTLIGVSFLRRLDKYQVENGALLLVQ